jgi:hypothetical protein
MAGAIAVWLGRIDVKERQGIRKLKIKKQR